MRISLIVNGLPVEAELAARVLLADFLRDTRGLTGTKVGCDTGQCGSCTVLLDGRSVKSCSVLAVQADGTEVTTIEGLNIGDGPGLDELQNALWEQHAVQCGFCTPGVVVSLHDRLARNRELTEPELRDWLAGNL